ncbi:HARBI1 [Mytilus coruscus]|uniref:HARBI1 n=1 Tax=Mytilus coruscus TaxID=42192 RepID=A0A6J8CT64_MYTCO|nr:HARBI1 [Mytilus coruscus]
MQKKWVEHACNVMGCKDRYCTIDGNEKLRRSICDNGGDKIINDKGLTVQDCCPEDPEFGGKHGKPNSSNMRLKIFIVAILLWALATGYIPRHCLGMSFLPKKVKRVLSPGDWGSVWLYDKSTVISRAVDNVTNTILARKVDFISWPTSKTDVDEVKTGFHEQADFLHVVGCIDCTHVRFQKPSEDEAAFVNRTNSSSINVQAVCNHEVKPFKIL